MIPKLSVIASLPPSTRAVSATPAATIADNGQITLNRAASAAFKTGSAAFKTGNFSHVVPLADGTTGPDGTIKRNSNWIGLQGVKEGNLPKGVSADVILPIQWLKTKDSAERTHAAIALSRLLRAIGYEYKVSGRQAFSVTVDEKAGTVMLEVPTGALPAPEVRHRAPNASKSAGAGNSPDAGAATNTNEVEELELQEA